MCTDFVASRRKLGQLLCINVWPRRPRMRLLSCTRWEKSSIRINDRETQLLRFHRTICPYARTVFFAWVRAINLGADCDTLHTLPNILAPLGIMGDQLKASLRLLSTMVLWWPKRVQGGGHLLEGSPRYVIPSDSYTSDGVVFPVRFRA